MRTVATLHGLRAGLSIHASPPSKNVLASQGAVAPRCAHDEMLSQLSSPLALKLTFSSYGADAPPPLSPTSSTPSAPLACCSGGGGGGVAGCCWTVA